jgi:hypothetical protein
MNRISLIATALLAALLFGCGGGGGGGTTDSTGTLPAAPSGVTAQAADQAVTVSWNTVSGATSYNVYMATQSGVTRDNYASLSGGMQHMSVTSPYLHTGLANGTTYYFIVTAQNAAGESAGSAEVSATPSVVVVLAPNITRQPVAVTTHHDGSALMFVVATGSSLNYEWKSLEFGTIVKSGPEPFILRTSQSSVADDGDCYEVTVSNTADSVTSNQVCKSVGAVSYNFNADGGDIEPDGGLALAYGNALLAIVRNTVGTGPFAAHGSVRPPLGPAGGCGYSGSFLGATLDGVAVTSNTAWPVGEHNVSLAWNQCYSSPDAIVPAHGSLLANYNFPSVFGIGTYTVHMSGLVVSDTPMGAHYVLNGTIVITSNRTTNGLGQTVDEFEIVLQDDFTISNAVLGVFKRGAGTQNSLTAQLTLGVSLQTVSEASVDFSQLSMAPYDVDGLAAESIYASGTVTFDHVGGTTNGTIEVNTYHGGLNFIIHGVLAPSGVEGGFE